VFSLFIIILYNKNKVFLFHFYIFVYLDASLEKEETTMAVVRFFVSLQGGI